MTMYTSLNCFHNEKKFFIQIGAEHIVVNMLVAFEDSHHYELAVVK